MVSKSLVAGLLVFGVSFAFGYQWILASTARILGVIVASVIVSFVLMHSRKMNGEEA
jgi:protein-S-isoprenylcysteine O-methyltransferase Ste14